MPACDASNPEVTFIRQDSDWSRVNEPGLRIFCVHPGDYSAAGVIRLERSGTAARPRVIRRVDAGLHPLKLRASARVTLQALTLRGAEHWVVDGLFIRGGERVGLWLKDASRNVLNRLVVQEAEWEQVRFEGASHGNVLQDSVVRRSKIVYGGDRVCVLFVDPGPGHHQQGNRLVQNEIYDCTDGIQLYSRPEFLPGGRFRDLVIDENDIYLSKARRTDCRGKLQWDGPCSCGEEGIDIKLGGSGDLAQERVTISNNRIWGWLETDQGPKGDWEDACGASGSWGGLVVVGMHGSHVVVKDNFLEEGPRGVTVAGSARNTRVIGNHLHRIDRARSQQSIATIVAGRDSEVLNNTVVDSGSWINAQDSADGTVARCNSVVSSKGQIGWGGSNSLIDFNTYHASKPSIALGAHDSVHADTSRADSGTCYLRKRWTKPEVVCVPHGSVGGPAGCQGA